MSFIDLAKSLMGDPEGRKKAIALVSTLIEQNGGLHGVIDKLHQGGLGELVQSWIGTGENKSVTPQQLENALGSGKLDQLAAKAGIDPAQARQQLTKILPTLIDRLTPNGKLPAPGEAPSGGGFQAMLTELLSKKGDTHAA